MGLAAVVQGSQALSHYGDSMLARLRTKLGSTFGFKAPKSRGQGLLEFALVLPLLLLFILGIIEAGRMLAIYSSLSSASKQAARYGSVAGDSISDSTLAFYEDCNGIRQAALRASILVGLEPDDIGIGYDRGNSAESIGRCALNDPTPTISETIQDGYRVVVTTTVVYKPLVPIVPLPDMPITFVAARTIFTSIAGPTNTPRPNPDLRIAKAGLPLVVSPNGMLTYWITATNPLTGVVLANDVVVTDTLPISLTITTAALNAQLDDHADPNESPWECVVAGPPPHAITCERTPPLAPGQSSVISFTVQAPTFGGVVLTNTTGVQSNKIDLNNVDNYTQTSNVVLPGADLQVFKSVTPTLVGAGTPLTYSLSAVNNGGGTSRVQSTGPTQTYIWITDTLPAGVGLKQVIWNATHWECPNRSAFVVGCYYKHNLDASTTTLTPVTIVITAPMTAQTLLNTAVITPSTLTADPLPLNNVVTATAQVSTDADLELFMGVPSGPFDLNRSFTIRLNVTNRGPSVASGVVINYTLPGGLAYDSAAGWAGCTPSGSTVNCTYAPTIYPGTTSADLVLTVHGIAEGSQVSVADATGAQPDPDALVLPVDTHREGTTTITNCQPGQVWGPSSTISGGSPNQIQANNTATSTITVELRDRCNALVTTSQDVTLSSNRGGADTISPATVNTSSGQATFTVKSGTTGTSQYSAVAISPEPDQPVNGTANVNYYGCVSFNSGAVGGSQDFLPFEINNTSGLTRRLIGLEVIWPSGGSKRFTGVTMQGTSIWTGSANSSPTNISGTGWIANTDGARTVPNNPASPLPVLRVSFNFLVVNGTTTQTFTLKSTWDDGNGGSLCTQDITVTR